MSLLAFWVGSGCSNNRYRPSGDQSVGFLLVLVWSRSSSPPELLADFRYRSKTPLRFDAKAIWVPSGDHTGDMSLYRGAESEPCLQVVRQLIQPDINVPRGGIEDIDGQLFSIRRELRAVIDHRFIERVGPLALAVVPDQLGSARRSASRVGQKAAGRGGENSA